MSNCSECASLCCIAPKISTPKSWQGRLPWKVIKWVNARCEHLLDSWECGIYNARGFNYDHCTRYDCKDFGPILTKYLRIHDLTLPDGTLKEDGFSLFRRLNGALQLSQISHGQNTDLTDALSYFQEFGEWPDWLMNDNYIKYLEGKCENPRFTPILGRRKIWKIFRKP